jgi:hypothetical protein
MLYSTVQSRKRNQLHLRDRRAAFQPHDRCLHPGTVPYSDFVTDIGPAGGDPANLTAQRVRIFLNGRALARLLKERKPGAMLYGMFGGEKDERVNRASGALNGKRTNVNDNDRGVALVARMAVNFFGALNGSVGDLEESAGAYFQDAGAILRYWTGIDGKRSRTA